jgi:hypothetical protein
MLIKEAKQLQKLAGIKLANPDTPPNFNEFEQEVVQEIDSIIKKLRKEDTLGYSGVTPYLQEAIYALEKLRSK